MTPSSSAAGTTGSPPPPTSRAPGAPCSCSSAATRSAAPPCPSAPFAGRRRAAVALLVPRQPAAAGDRRRARPARRGSRGGACRPTRPIPARRARGLLVDAGDAAATRASFAALGAEADHAGVGAVLRARRRRSPSGSSRRCSSRCAVARTCARWSATTPRGALVERPLGEAIEAAFADDVVRGVVLTDALIGTFAGAHDADLRQNRCFLYHVIGGGTGDWDLPVGGMGAVSGALRDAALAAGAEIVTRTEVTAVGAAARSSIDGRARRRRRTSSRAPRRPSSTACADASRRRAAGGRAAEGQPVACRGCRGCATRPSRPRRRSPGRCTSTRRRAARGRPRGRRRRPAPGSARRARPTATRSATRRSSAPTCGPPAPRR